VILRVLSHLVIYTHEIVAECRYHKELLHHAVHITDAPKVHKANVLLVSVSTVCRSRRVLPTTWLLDKVHQWNQLIAYELHHQTGALPDEAIQKHVCGISTFVTRTCL
jgi:hypothetical protein